MQFSLRIKILSCRIQPSTHHILFFLISELSDQGKIIRTFDPRSIGTLNLTYWKPEHISVDENGNLFVVDLFHDSVYRINSRMTDLQIFLNKYQHQLKGSHRLCWVQDKHMLFVGQTGFVGEPGLFSVFDPSSVKTMDAHWTCL